MYKRQLPKPSQKEKSIFLFGPRGTGKTTWLKEHLKDAIFIDLLKTEIYTELIAKPEKLREFIPEGFKEWVVIDEVQKIPQILNEVHHLIEDKGLKFVLTGSSARSLRKKGVNLLAGRAIQKYMHPLTAAELGEEFDLLRSIEYGQLPQAYNLKDPKNYLKTYVQTYLKEEVLQEGLTRNLGAFSRFLEIASFSQGSVLNVSEVAREAQIDRQVAENYFSILEDLLLARRVPVFSRRAKRRLVKHSKFYYFDSGVFQTLRPKGPLDSPSDIAGPALETLCLQEILASNDYLEAEFSLYFWRTANGEEVDFVLYGPNGFLAIEVKKSRSIHSKDLKGLKKFKQDYPEAKAIILYTGNEKRYINDITAYPIQEFLKSLPKLLKN